MAAPTWTLDDIVSLLKEAGLPPQESVVLPPRDARHAPVPPDVAPKLAQELGTAYPGGLYSHQAMALGALLAGEDVCLATPTASGKSLVFMAAAMDIILRKPLSKVLAFYPAKALIQDQMSKWEAFLAPFGFGVGFIDGSVPTNSRGEILRQSRVVAMTPDVAHAWLMSHLASRDVRDFLGQLHLVVLDETHVYEGAFGTNMAYFLRRLEAAAHPYRIISSTATVGEPASMMHQLTGRQMKVIGAEHDGSAVAEKTLLLCPSSTKGGFDRAVTLLATLSQYGRARFLAFGDSRKAVERIVAAVLRQNVSDAAEQDDGVDDGPDERDGDNWPKLEHVLPFRAGYETEDRTAVQKALSQGSLAGVVSTSAMELGLDIGDLDIVVLLNTPPSMKAFRQRIGRAGRRGRAVCILLDDQDLMAPLSKYLDRQPEASWLYLANRYIQYSNALCAAVELQARGVKSVTDLRFDGLPDSFCRFIDNEINPTAAVPEDLYHLKQRGQANPHYEFPIRSAAEPTFKVEGPFGRPLGTLSYAQALREAYPGAVYYYMARPFRIQSLEFKKGFIRAGKSKFLTTKPVAENMAFPDFRNGVLSAWKAANGFVAEVQLQVSERVKGFIEQRGKANTAHEYGPASPYSQKPLNRFFKTTGVCWSFPDDLGKGDTLARRIMEVFSFTCGVQDRDLGVALFHSNEGLLAPTPTKGVVIFDSTNGSLRLTERLARDLALVAQAALDQTEEPPDLRAELRTFASLVSTLEPFSAATSPEPPPADGDWVRLIGRDQPAIYQHADGPMDVRVKDFRYTPNGVMYELNPLAGRDPGAPPMKWMVLASHVQPINGTTSMIRYNLVTGEEAPGAPPAVP